MSVTIDLKTATAQEYFAAMAINSWRINPIDGIAQAPTTPMPGVVEYISPDATPVEMQLRKGTPEYVLATGDVDPFWATIPGNPAKTYLFFPKGLTNGSKISIKIGHHTWYDLDIPVSTQNPFPPGMLNWCGDDIARDFPGITLAPGLGDPHRDPPGIPHVQATRVLAPQQRALRVYEANPATAGGGRMFALNANTATGIPIPAFKNVVTNPPTGQLVGEAILNTTTGQSFVWTGAIWQGIIPPSVIPYPTDTDVLTDNLAPAGTHAFSQSSGNFFTRYTDAGGTIRWRQIGIRVFPLEAGLLAATEGVGQVGYAQDTQNLWLQAGTNWEPLSAINDTEANILAATYRNGVYAHATDTDNSFIRTGGNWIPIDLYRSTDATIQAATFPNGTMAYATDTGQHWYRIGGGWQPGFLYKDSEANVLAATYQDGTVAYATDTNVFYYRVNGNWVLNTPLVDTEANIKAATAKVGQIAIATDTGKLWVGTATGWQGQPFRDYATEAALLADTPIDGMMAVAIDTGVVYYRTSGNWIPVNANALPSGATDPATATAALGGMFFNTAAGVAKVFNGTNWVVMGVNTLSGLTDVDLTTAPQDNETLVFDAGSNTFKPGVGGGVQMGTEPGPPDRYDGMLWWSGSRLFIWVVAANAWIQT